jgi:hypothetical protein
VIVRLSGDGQYQLDDHVSAMLNELDDALEQAVAGNDSRGLRAALDRIHDTVRKRGIRVADDDLRASDAFIPPANIRLDEIEALLGEEGLIPD